MRNSFRSIIHTTIRNVHIRRIQCAQLRTHSIGVGILSFSRSFSRYIGAICLVRRSCIPSNDRSAISWDLTNRPF